MEETRIMQEEEEFKVAKQKSERKRIEGVELKMRKRYV